MAVGNGNDDDVGAGEVEDSEALRLRLGQCQQRAAVSEDGLELLPGISIFIDQQDVNAGQRADRKETRPRHGSASISHLQSGSRGALSIFDAAEITPGKAAGWAMNTDVHVFWR